MRTNWKPGLLNLIVAATMSSAAVSATAADDHRPLLLAQAPAATAPGAMRAADRMDVNSASESDLATLPGIGEVRAKAIVKGRPYGRKDDLVKKNVLSEGVYEKIQERIIAKQQ